MNKRKPLILGQCNRKFTWKYTKATENL